MAQLPPPPAYAPNAGYQQPAFNPNYQQQQQYPPGQPMAPGWGGQPQYGQPSFGNQSYGQGYPPQPTYGAQQPYAATQQHYDVDPETGQPKYDGVGFSNKSIRAGFIRKVFSLVCIMLVCVAAMVSFFTFHQPAKNYIKYSGQWLYWTSYGVFLVVYISLVCCEGVRRKHPLNLVLTALLTLSIGYMTAMIAAFYDTTIVFMTAGLCAVCCFGIILFSSQTKYDFTSWMGVMFVVFFVVFIFGIAAIFVAIFTGSKIMYLVYSGLMALVFMVYLAIDVQMVIGGKKYEISPEDYIFAAIQLFLDVVYIFWMLLSLLGGSSR